ncbi:MAG: TlpA family protein disulfide reductase [Thermoanaerobaculia bacterium]|nr:TlpA family protein disulfide reductase [Thermoanaerobaculia bacterium]
MTAPLSRPRRLYAVATLLLSTSVATCGWSAAEAPEGGQAPAARPPLPPFELAAVSGEAVDGAAFRGRVVLYEFWATWCTPCHVQVEILKSIYPRARAAGVEFVAVAAGEPVEIVREHLAKSPYPYPSLLDPEEELSTALQVLGLPTLLVVDRDGGIVWRQTGLTDEATIVEALAEAGAALAD